MIKKMIPLLCIFLAGIMVVSSGAFSSVTAERSSGISVVGDAEALISLASTSSYSHFEDGMMVLDFEDVPASGVNSNAVTVISDVFSITNNGNSDVVVTIAKTGKNVSSVDFGDIEHGVVLSPGCSYDVCMSVDTNGLIPGAELLESISISAVA
ncbi:MAG TPA: hypothetical protein PK718_04215 [Candidatus Methanofastidiosa archaeon]|nr:hypothetical protein [Candidatus Methanofastidiosa archaeon]HPR41737.1 hypothetical protein [Candidatus Methanofastidiosa archaeon]